MTQERYSRQILFKDIGEHGQQTINQKHVLIVGMGALGTHVAEGTCSCWYSRVDYCG